jgi:methylenetetrahydrofolate dehydrogenase (NADP+)/methenyltetrahydrofolate cyclohydrolase
MKIIDGKALAKKIKDDIAAEVFSFDGQRPNLAIIMVGDRADSQIYVSLKEREGQKVGIDVHVYKLDSDTTQAQLEVVIDFLNKDQLIDGILLQLPLPLGLNTDAAIKKIDPEKDVDGFRPDHPDFIVSPVVGAIRTCLESTGEDISGRKACLLYNSEVFSRQIVALFDSLSVKISCFHEAEGDMASESLKKADVVVSALGRPEYITGSMIGDGAILIDIGITKVGDQVLGDFNAVSVAKKAAWITPVPGGIGPLTVAHLLDNVLSIYKKRHAN